MSQSTESNRIALMGGSFNPPHLGHLILTNHLLTYESIDQVWWMVTPHNPLKHENELADETFRLKLATAAAAESHPNIHVSDFEFNLPRPSFTIQTLEALKQKYPKHQFTLIIGADNWQQFDRWHDWKKIIDHYPIQVYPRAGYPIVIPDELAKNVSPLNSPLIEISSTSIRQAYAAGKEANYLLPKSVHTLLQKHNPYVKK